MTATVRSVRVVMEAEVAKYIADMKLAGRETRKAFDQANVSVSGTRSNFDAMSKSEQAVERDMAKVSAQAKRTARDLDGVGTSSRRVGKEIDTVSGRAHVLLDALVLLGPALAPIGALGVPALAGLAGAAGASLIPVAATAIAVQGLGDAFKALDKARIEPTAENMQAAREATDNLAPAAQRLVTHLYGLRGEWIRTRNITAQGLFPGVNKGISQLQTRLPELQRFLFDMSRTTGRLFREGATDLASDHWHDFFNYLEQYGRPLLDDTAHAVGNVAHGLGELFAATAPDQLSFTHWLVDTTGAFDRWADRMQATDGFRDFMEYAAQNGPKVAHAAGEIADAVIQIVEAAAPLGGPTLDAIASVAHLIGDIAGSDAGTPLAALAVGLTAVARARRLLNAAGGNDFIANGYVKPLKELPAAIPTLSQVGTVLYRAGQSSKYASEETLKARKAVGEFGKSLAPIGKGAAVLGGVAVASTGVADSFGLTHTASLALMGTIAGPWGAAIGAGAGAMLDFKSAAEQSTQAVQDLDDALFAGDRDQLVAAITAANDKLNNLSWFDKLIGTDEALRAGLRSAKTELEGFDAAGGHSGDVADLLGETIGLTGGKFRIAAGDVRAMSSALSELNGWLDKRDALRNYQQAVDDFGEKLKKHVHNFDITTEKGRENQAVLDQVAAGIAQVANQIKNPGRRESFIHAAIGDLREMAGKASPEAEAAIRRVIRHVRTLDTTPAKPKITADTSKADRMIGETKRKVKDLDRAEGRAKLTADRDQAQSAFAWIYGELGKVDRKRAHPKVLVDAGQALGTLGAVQAAINALHSKTITINTVRRGAGLAKAADVADAHGADGLTVPGPRQPYGDKMLILAAPGEEIISNRHGEADRFRADRAAGLIPAYADGGEAGRRGPRGQLTGLGGYLQVPELAHRIADYLGARQIRSLGRQMDDLSKKNLTRLGKALDKATDLQEKHTAAAKDAFDQVAQQRAGYASTITQALTRDLFTGSSSPFDGGYGPNSILGATSQLNQQSRDARDMERLERILRERGVRGGALEQILSGGIDRVRAAAASSSSQLRAYQTAYDTAQRYTASAANTGAALLTPAFDALKAKYDQEVAESRAIKEELQALRREERGRHAAEQKTRRQAPAATAAALNNRARQARRA